MEKYEHLKLPIFKGNVERQRRTGGGFSLPTGRDKRDFAQQAVQKVDEIKSLFSDLKTKFSGNIDPTLIYEIEINQSVNMDGFEKILSSMGIHVLSVAEGKKGFWVVFSDDAELSQFKEKLSIYGTEEGPNYDFFNAIESFQDIPTEKKVGKNLKDNPLTDAADFIDIELWKMTDPQKNETFIQELKDTYTDLSTFRITDTLSTKTFVLLRIKLTKEIFDEIIELKEIARATRPSRPQFNPFEFTRPDIADIEFNEPSEDAIGILVIDSGIVSNHPMLEKCVGGEDNFQSGEAELQDTVGHGTAVAGCAAYGDIDNCLREKNFTPENWVFSAKVMYAEKNDITNTISAVYDPEKLIEHQFKDAVESFLSNPDYHIKVVNISLGNHNEIWHKDYSRQLPLAALIDELAFTFSNVIFIVSAGNQDPRNHYNTVQDIKDNYPSYLVENMDFRLNNPATSALAFTIGSIAGTVRIAQKLHGAEDIKTAIAEEHQPSPFTRTGTGINGMIKPELVEYGGNLILSEVTNSRRITEDLGGKISLLNNRTTEDIIKYDYGTSFSAPKLAYLTGRIANKYPQGSSNFIKNMLLVGSDYPFITNKDFYNTENNQKAETKHLSVCGFGLSCYEKAINSYSNRPVLWDEGEISLNQIKVYSLQLPEIFFSETGTKKIIVTLTFNPETRLTRGDSYLGNRMEFHLFHSVNPQVLIEKYGVISDNTAQVDVPEDLKKFEIKFYPGPNTRKAGCHQKAWKEYKREPRKIPSSPISLVLLSLNKWINDDNRMQDYCISVIFEHEQEIELYNEIMVSVQARTRVRRTR